VVRIWPDPDEGVWEVRDERRHFVFSKVMAWVALDRAVAAVEDLELDHDDSDWRAAMAEIREEVLERGWNDELRTFVQHYDTTATDAANVVLPIVRFLPADDPRILDTLRRIQAELGHPSGFVYRYRAPDGLPEGEGAFWVSTFQMAQALAQAGRRDEAVEIFESAVAHASPLGLLSEEVDPGTGTLLGNFPQAFSHIGLINAAHVLARTAPE
jgi:GH15 family glucan-1,4-alpha-glucosidase